MTREQVFNFSALLEKERRMGTEDLIVTNITGLQLGQSLSSLTGRQADTR